MSALVVLDCFDTLVTSRPLPGPERFTVVLADALELDTGSAGAVVHTVYGTLYEAMTDPGASQPATLDLMEGALRAQGAVRERAAVEGALWRALGCADPDEYVLCAPVAEAALRAHEAGHTLRLLSNCYLPGDLMWDLLRRAGAPDIFDRGLFTADGGPKKPDARAFRRIGEGDFERRVMVGDSAELDLAPAAALGWDTVRVTPGAPVPDAFFTLLDL
ncbi:HAD family hydrolase [Streptomyces atrovirens]|uniref:HAD family hydrolase n=1 Tax=Streptomyces atrovirens TaxID=285556 RepID=A0ABW0DMB1_9ACTN